MLVRSEVNDFVNTLKTHIMTQIYINEGSGHFNNQLIFKMQIFLFKLCTYLSNMLVNITEPNLFHLSLKKKFYKIFYIFFY